MAQGTQAKLLNRLGSLFRSAWSESRCDFSQAVGHSPISVVHRLLRSFKVLRGMMRGDNIVSSLPVRLQVEITDKCNFDCIMCNRLTRPNVTYKLANDIGYDEMKRLLDVIKPHYVTLNGLGEPALHKSIDKILMECNSRGINTQLPSNMSIKKVMIEKVAPHAPTVLTFSMHGATKETFEAISLGSVFEECVELFEAVVARVDPRKTEIRILCALQAQNLLEYNEFYEFLKRWNMLKTFYLVPVLDYEVKGDAARRIIPSLEEIERAADVLQREVAACRDPEKSAFLTTWREVTLSLVEREVPAINTSPCLVPWFSTYISAKGNVLPCCLLTDEQHVLGNINEEPFEQIWNGKKYQEFRQQLRDNRGRLDGCRTCPRNDSARISRYKMLSFATTKWHLDQPADPLIPSPTLQETPIRIHVAAHVPVTIKGKPILPRRPTFARKETMAEARS